MVKSSLLSEILTSSIQTTAIQVVPQKCLRSRLNSCRCTLCLDICPHKAISLDENTITVAENKCQGCMLCSTVCPNDALASTIDLPVLLIDDLPLCDTITFTCRQQQQYQDDEVVLPCLATLPAEALLYLCLTERASNLFFNAKHCSTCPNLKSFQIFSKLFETIAAFTKGFAKPSLILQTQEGPTTESTRRVFLKSIKNAFTSKHRKNAKTCAEEGLSRPSNRAITKRGKLVKEARNLISPSKIAAFSELTENRMIFDESCIPCNRCTGICPTGALSLQKSANKKELAFISEKCSGCQLCVLFCKQKALTLVISPLSRITLNK